MNFLFGKRQSVRAMAELLEDGSEIMNEEMKKPKYNNYAGGKSLLMLQYESSRRTRLHSRRRCR